MLYTEKDGIFLDEHIIWVFHISALLESLCDCVPIAIFSQPNVWHLRNACSQKIVAAFSLFSINVAQL